jgi:nucleoside-diphosphate-sugar epimerase
VTILVTGAGHIGSLVAQRLQRQHDCDVVLYDVAFSQENLATRVDLSRVSLLQGDITEPTEVLGAVKSSGATAIIHTAALLTDAVNARLARGVHVNLMGTLAVLEAARLNEVPRVVFCSSGSTVAGRTYGAGEKVPEDVALNCFRDRPTNVYSTMKLAGEWLCRNYEDAFGVSVVSVRPAGVYGPWHGTPSGQPARLFRRIVEGARSGQLRLSPADLGAGMDFVHAADVAQVLVLAALHPAPPSPVYNAASGVASTARDLLDVAEGVLGRPIPIEVEGDERTITYAAGPCFDIRRAEDELGYKVEYPLRRGVEEYIEWLGSGDAA